MKICLVRHGRPKPVSCEGVSSEVFSESWLKDFDATGIDPWARPPQEMMDRARKCRAVVTSPLQRAHDSARILFPDRSILVEPSLREFGLPSLPLPLIKFPPGVWVMLCRILWFVGYCRGTESLSEARARARRGAELLQRMAGHNDSVAFVGHGLINTLIARELRQMGWQGPPIPGRKHWDVSEYTSTMTPIKGREALKGSRVAVPKPETV
ncbi:histidine phosphatase family protein [Nitrospirota bacterium]